MGDLLRDVVYAFRQMRQKKLLTALILCLVALGIGANTLIFSFVDGLLLKSLPVRDPQNLFRIEENRKGQVKPNPYINYSAYRLLSRNVSAFQSVFAECLLPYNGTYPLMLNGQVCLITVDSVSGNFFTDLGIKAARGRVLAPYDEKARGISPAVVSYRFWKGQLGSAANIPGRAVRIKDHVFTIVGVLPRDFHGLNLDFEPDVTVPLSAATLLTGRPLRNFYAYFFIRLKPGATLPQASAQTEPIVRDIENQGIAKDQPDASPALRHEILDFRIGFLPLEHGISQLRGLFSHALMLLMGAVALLLLIVCFNIGGLLLARAQTRRKEIAVRLSVGANRWRILRQLLTESILLGTGGAILGTCLAYALAPALVQLLPILRDPTSQFALTPFVDLLPDWRVLGFIIAACFVTGILFGIVPALAALRIDLNTELKAGSGQRVPGSRLNAGSLLIGLQVMLTSVLVIASGLMISTYWKLLHAPTGLDSDHIIVFRIDPRSAGYKSEQLRAFYEQLQQEIEVLPQVRAASWADRGLMHGKGQGLGTTIVPTRQTLNSSSFNTSWNLVSPAYFDTMGMRLLEGRDLRFNDPQSISPVIVNEAFARAFFPGQDVIGRTFSYAWNRGAKPNYRIVGLVTNAKYRSLREVPPPTFYSLPAWSMSDNGTMALNVRTYGDPRSVIGEVRQALKRFDPHVPIIETATMKSAIQGSLWQERLVLVMTAFFGIAALLLAGIGLYGALMQAVMQRTREIGIRMALGAQIHHIITGICTSQLWPVLIGALAGLAASAALTRAAASLLYGISPLDPLSYALAIAFVLLVALLAAFLPSLRAVKVEPAVVLRGE